MSSAKKKGSLEKIRNCVLLLAIFFAMVGSAHAQDASIEGQIIDAEMGEALPGTTVLIEELGQGTTTNTNGFFRFEDIPPGEYTIVVSFVGYQEQTQEVSVGVGEELTVSIDMLPARLGLDEIVVTGQPGRARGREIGTSVERISVDDIIEPTASMEGLLSGRVAGMTVSQTSGAAGAGGQIRLRGNVSASMSNQPLIYIDGVRVRSDPYPRNVPPVGFSGRGPRATATPINDINPADVENVEVTRGASATTIYGSEAAPGVIQIFTRTGSPLDRPVWSFQVDQGANWTREFGNSFEGGERLFMDPFLQTAHTQQYSLSVRGGGQEAQYFVSGSYQNNNGVIVGETDERVSLRGNIRSTLADGLVLRSSASYTQNDIVNQPQGNNAQGITLNAFRRTQNYFGDDNPELLRGLMRDYEINTLNNRYTLGSTLLFQQSDNVEHELTAGYDFADSNLSQFRRFGFIAAPQGIAATRNWRHETFTVDYTGSMDVDVSSDLRMSVAWGGERIEETTSEIATFAQGFPGPGELTLTAATESQAFEDKLRTITGGVFSQVRLGYQDRYFLTLGARVDGNSAFGEDFGLQAYPKADASYVLSDEGFWNNDWGTLRLRAAYGWAGRAPGAFDAVRTWNPIGFGDRPAFTPQNIGNPDLGPERTREVEFGFNSAFFNERLSLDFTYYDQRTQDALLAVSQIPSSGNWPSQLENVGEIANWGTEVQLNVVPVSTEQFSWDIGFNASLNRSEVVDLGGAPEFSLGNFGWVVEGEPLPLTRGERITNPDEIADPEVENNYNYGPNHPTHTLQPSMRFGLPFLDASLSVRGEYQGGHYMQDGASQNALARGVRFPHPTCVEVFDRGLAVEEMTAEQRGVCVPEFSQGGHYIEKADFFKLREVSLRLSLPWTFSEHGSATLTLSGLNLYTWTALPILDPEMTWDGAGQNVRRVAEHLPPPVQVRTRLNITF